MNSMKKLTFLQENLYKKIVKNLILTFLLVLLNWEIIAKEKWAIDKNISKISFEVPVLFATNVIGEFKNFDGFVEIDIDGKKNNKAILSVQLASIKINYEKYKDLLLSPIFFDQNNYPLAVLDTKKFSYSEEKELKLDVELTIKGLSKNAKTKLKINRLTSDIVQIEGELEFKRNDFNIGIDKWKNTTILKNEIKIKTNLFLIKE